MLNFKGSFLPYTPEKGKFCDIVLFIQVWPAQGKNDGVDNKISFIIDGKKGEEDCEVIKSRFRKVQKLPKIR